MCLIKNKKGIVAGIEWREELVGWRGVNGKISAQKAGGDGLHMASEATALDFVSSMISHRKRFENFEQGSDT